LATKPAPALFAAVKSVSFNTSDPTCELCDRSGSIRGMIHRDVAEKYPDAVAPGAVLVLRDLHIILGHRHHVIVTMTNLAEVYSRVGAGPGSGVHATKVVRLTEDDLARLVLACEKYEKEKLLAHNVERRAGAADAFPYSPSHRDAAAAGAVRPGSGGHAAVVLPCAFRPEESSTPVQPWPSAAVGRRQMQQEAQVPQFRFKAAEASAATRRPLRSLEPARGSETALDFVRPPPPPTVVAKKLKQFSASPDEEEPAFNPPTPSTQSALGADEVLDGLDEDSIFGDF